MIDTNWLRDVLLPENGPPEAIYRLAVPIWCGESPDELAEWAQGLYLRLRQYYLTTHTPADLLDWERCADETTRALPLGNADFVSESRETKLALELPDHIDTTAYRSGVRRIIMSKHTRKERL